MGIMDDTECYTLAEVQESAGQAFRAGEREEHARLRPLLEECLEVIDQYAPGFELLLENLRSELDHQ